MKTIVLIENKEANGLIGEHGLSFYIEFKGKHYLLDAGSTAAFLENAKRLELDLARVDACILSHGHYDHSGGFHSFFTEYGERPLYAMKQVQEKYFSGSGGSIHEIGVPAQLFADFGHCFRYIDYADIGIKGKSVMQPAEGMYLIPHALQQMCAGLAAIGARAKLYRQQGEGLVPDDFAHELSLVFDTEEGLVVFNSCSHAGIRVILEEVKQALPGRKIAAFLGGLHMKGKRNGEEICTFTEQEIKELADYLQAEGVERIYTGHCTGEPGYQLLKKELGERLGYLECGSKIVWQSH